MQGKTCAGLGKGQWGPSSLICISRGEFNKKTFAFERGRLKFSGAKGRKANRAVQEQGWKGRKKEKGAGWIFNFKSGREGSEEAVSAQRKKNKKRPTSAFIFAHPRPERERREWEK